MTEPERFTLKQIIEVANQAGALIVGAGSNETIRQMGDIKKELAGAMAIVWVLRNEAKLKELFPGEFS